MQILEIERNMFSFVITCKLCARDLSINGIFSFYVWHTYIRHLVIHVLMSGTMSTAAAV